MRRLMTSLAVLALLVSGAAAEQWRDVDIQTLIENAPDREEYPDASGLILKMQEATEVAEDGSTVTTRNKLIKVLTLRGRERHSNQSFLYNVDTDVVELVRGVTFRRNGMVIEVEDDAINDVTPAFLEDATVYANVLSKVISFAGAGPGSTMDVQVVERSLPAADRSFSGIEFMGAMDPILDAEFTLRYPDDKPQPTDIGFTGGLGQVKIVRTASLGEITYRVTDVPACVEEERMPPTSELFPRVLYSSYSDWAEPASFFAGLFFPHVETEGTIADHASEITAGLTSTEDIVRALYLDVTTGVRNVSLDLGLGGYEPNDASDVLANRYADTRDKAVLLISLLRAAGVEAYPAMVQWRTDSTFVESVPTLRQFSRLLVAIPGEAGYRFLDPFLDDARYGFLRWGRGNTALVVRDDGSGELVRVPAFEPEENRTRHNMTMVITEDGTAMIRAASEVTGYFDRKTRLTLKDESPSELKKVFDTAASGVSQGATNLSHRMSDLNDLTEPVMVLQNIEAPDLAVPQGDMMIVRIPQFPHGFTSMELVPSLAERKYAYEFPCEFVEELEVTMTIPDGYGIAWMPEDMSVATGNVTLSLSCESHEDQNSIVWRRSTTVPDRSVAMEDYETFKKSFDAFTSPKNMLVLLKRV